MDDKIIAIFGLCDDLLKALGLSPPGGRHASAPRYRAASGNGIATT